MDTIRASKHYLLPRATMARHSHRYEYTDTVPHARKINHSHDHPNKQRDALPPPNPQPIRTRTRIRMHMPPHLPGTHKRKFQGIHPPPERVFFNMPFVVHDTDSPIVPSLVHVRFL